MKRLLLSLSILAAGLTAYSQVQLVKDIYFGTDNSTPMKLTVFKGKLVFFAIDPVYGRELHMMDSAENISMVYNIAPGAGYSLTSGNFNTPMAVLNDMLYFYADDGTHGTELYKWDGDNPPMMVKEVNTSGSSNISDIIAYNNKIYFNAYTPATGYELWEYDPATDDIRLIADIYANASSSSPNSFFIYNNRFYFSAMGAGTGRELYCYDGTTDEVKMVMDIYTGSGSSNPKNFAIGNGRMYFSALDPAAGEELFSLTDTVVARLTDLRSGFSSSIGSALLGTSCITVWKGTVYFSGTDNSTTGYQLFKYDQKNNTASLVYSIDPIVSSAPNMFARFEDKLFFVATTVGNGRELWSYDGMGAPMMVADIYSGVSEGRPNNFMVFNNKLYFAATNADNGTELFSYIDSSLSVKNLDVESAVKVHPNPASITANIDINLKYAEQLAVIITDITGREVYNTGMSYMDAGNNTVSIPLYNLPAGNYVYNIINASGQRYTSGKLLKQ